MFSYISRDVQQISHDIPHEDLHFPWGFPSLTPTLPGNVPLAGGRCSDIAFPFEKKHQTYRLNQIDILIHYTVYTDIYCIYFVYIYISFVQSVMSPTGCLFQLVFVLENFPSAKLELQNIWTCFAQV